MGIKEQIVEPHDHRGTWFAWLRCVVRHEESSGRVAFSLRGYPAFDGQNGCGDNRGQAAMPGSSPGSSTVRTSWIETT
jgi:hypothetical protein